MQNNLKALGERLSEYRRMADPLEYKVPINGIRRTPGLRREEVATGVGVSAEVISKLERGKYPSVNAPLLCVLGNFYGLDAAKRADLFHLANIEERSNAIELAQSVPSELQEFVDHQREYPTFVINRRWDFVGWNEALNITFGDIGSMPESRRNILWIIFGFPNAPDLILDWERHARRVCGQFRLDYDWSQGDPRFVALVDELKAESKEFARLWAGPLDIQFKEIVLKQIRHPQLGQLDFQQMGFRPAADPDLLVGVHYPLNERTAQAIRSRLPAKQSPVAHLVAQPELVGSERVPV